MKSRLKAVFIAWRFYIVFALIFLFVLLLVGRVIDLAVLQKKFLQAQGDARALRVVTAPPFRGMITDRNGSPLAISTLVYSLWLNPDEFKIDTAVLQALSDDLSLQSAYLASLLKTAENKDSQFVYLQRGLSPQIADKIKQLKIPGLYMQEEYKRFYPEGEVAAHVIGFTNIDDQGSEGLELLYNQWLSGEPGKSVVIKDRKGRIVSQIKILQQQKHGNNLVLSIDKRIQYIAYRELLRGIQENKATSGSAVVMDVRTGEILAMVNQPSFNPNRRAQQSLVSLRNRAVTDVFEPGSTIKPFSLAVALASGKYTPQTIVNTAPGWMRIDHHVLHDEHRKGPMTVTEVLQHSSNVGVSKIMLTLPPEPVWNLFHDLGFGNTTEIHFPGEREGVLNKRNKWSQLAQAEFSIGYGFTVTVLQLAEAYTVLANHGIKIPISLLKLEIPPAGKRIIPENIANEILDMMKTVVVKGGTAEQANVPGYVVAGKTGTALIAGPHGYEDHHYTSSFVGIAPATHPRLVVAVVVSNPTGKQYYGGDVSGPIFSRIMEGTLRIYDIEPDDLTSLRENNDGHSTL